MDMKTGFTDSDDLPRRPISKPVFTTVIKTSVFKWCKLWLVSLLKLCGMLFDTKVKSQRDLECKNYHL